MGVRGWYARIYVKIDLSKPLVRRMLLKGVIQEVQYKGINSLCLSCSQMGHQKEWCPYTVKVDPPSLKPAMVAGLEEGEKTEARGNISQVARSSYGDETQEYGPWMIVKHKKVGPKSGGACVYSHKVEFGLGPSHSAKSNP